jgi:hypothetical protein
MKYTVEMRSGGMVYIKRFINMVQEFKSRWGIGKHTDSNVISQAYFHI